MIDEILNRAKKFNKIVAFLREQSPYWPEYIDHSCNDVGVDTLYVSTKVRIFRNDRWYTVHCMESVAMFDVAKKSMIYGPLIKQFIKSVYAIQNLYQITGIENCEEIDSLQMSEQERFMNDFNGKIDG